MSEVATYGTGSYGTGSLNPGRPTSHVFPRELSIPLGEDEYEAIVAEAEVHRLPVGTVLRTWCGPAIGSARVRHGLSR